MQSQLQRLIKQVYFFRELSDSEIETIASYCKKEHFLKGEVIFHESSLGDKFYIILDGEVAVWKSSEGQEADLLAVHGKGHMFGEMALIDELPRSATVIARTGLEVLSIGREDFGKIIHENSSIALSIMKSVSSMVRKSNESFVEDLRKRNIELEEANRELKETQEELLRSERFSNLGKFSSLILHDIRNPISVLKGYAQMILLNLEEKEKVHKYAENIIKESERLNQLASELLDYSRGEIRLNMSIVSVPNFFEKVKRYIADRFKVRNIEYHLNTDVKEPVMMDEERMVRVILNLADNAKKAMPDGGVFSINAEKLDDHLVISVSDTGEGMSEEVKRKVFEPFYSFSRRGGTGLGMVVVRNIVEAHEGYLSIHSEEGKGTAVKITLPLRT